jgi:hypothetical protein
VGVVNEECVKVPSALMEDEGTCTWVVLSYMYLDRIVCCFFIEVDMKHLRAVFRRTCTIHASIDSTTAPHIHMKSFFCKF